MKVAGILLAAGRSRRFGAQDKLLANLRGRALVSYAAHAMAQLDVAHRFAVTADQAVADCLDGYEIIMVPGIPRTMAQNIAVGVNAARQFGFEYVLIALGDMPNVLPTHFEAVMAKCSPLRASASSDGMNRMPPACFPACNFDQLLSLSGEYGASHIIQTLPEDAIIYAERDILRDVDFVRDL